MVGVLGLAACGGSSSSSSKPAAASASASLTPKQGGTLTYDAFSEVKGWKPTELSGNNGGEDRGAFIYDTLLLATPSGGWKPNIATAITTTDSKTWTMTLRPGVKFTDGTPFDAAAVVYNTKLEEDPKSAAIDADLVSMIASMTAVDATTVQFVLNRTDGSFPIAFTAIPGMIASPTALQGSGDAFESHPIGAGPFTVTSFVRNSETKLVRNATYWDSPRPYLDAVDVKVITDSTVRAQSLISGEADMVVNDASVQTAVKQGTNLTLLSSAQSNGANAIIANRSKAPFDDVRIRQAMALAFDYSVVNQSLEQGSWPSQSLPCPPFVPGSDACAKDIWPAPDLAKAKQLVQSYVADGHTLGSYEFLTNTARNAEAQLVQQQLGAIGIKITKIDSLAVPDFTARLTAGSYDIAYNGVSAFDVIPTNWYRNLSSTQAHRQQGPVNPALDAAIEQAAYGLTEADRTAGAIQVQKINATEFDYIWFAPFIYGLAGKKTVHLGDRYTGSVVTVPQDIWIG